MLNVVDEFTHKGLAIRVARKLKATDVIDVLSDLFILRGIPGHIRSDNGPEFVAQAVQDWIRAVGSKPATIEPGSPWENGYVESFNARLRDELLNGEILCSLRKAEVILERRRRHTNTVRPHASLGYSPPAPEVLIPALATPPAAPIQPAPPARLPVAPQPRPNQHPPRPLKGDCSGRSRAETKMHCVKLLGQRLTSRDFEREIAEFQLRVAVLNDFTAPAESVAEALE
jgi:hypothetical protein